MELNTFGFNGHSQLNAEVENGNSLTQEDFSRPRRVLNSQSIEILWASWCDSLVALRPSNAKDAAARVIYNGAGLSEEQVNYVKNNFEAVREYFGAPLSGGLSGMLETGESSRVTFFQSSHGGESTTPDIETFSVPEGYSIQHISITSGGNVSAVATHRVKASGTQVTQQGLILQFDSILRFKLWLRTSQGLASRDMIPFTQCKQVVSNATTTTVLSSSGQVFTWTRDPRFPRCLGRPSDNEMPSHKPCEIPYLSETKIAKIASGGYMTAAISEDGELFLWGQACPGTESELKSLVLRDVTDAVEEQDDFVKHIPLESAEGEARAMDVAVGSGHILVAVNFEAQRELLDQSSSSRTSRAVYVMGQGESGQLGLETMPSLVSELAELCLLTGKRVKSMAAAGWSSWVVVEAEKKFD